MAKTALRAAVFFRLMEVAGIEPASENLSALTSPITAGYYLFPSLRANRHARKSGSFMGSFRAAKLKRERSPPVDAGPSGGGKTEADGGF